MILSGLAACGLSEATVVTVGTFDGLHRGHQALLEQVKERANEKGLKSLVLTFPQPPQNHMQGKPKKRLILPPTRKVELIEGYGIDAVVVVEFEEIGGLSPSEFASLVLKDRLKAAEVVVGYDCRFGKGRAGDGETLTALGQGLGFQVRIVEPVMVEGVVVSSTEVRRAIEEGEVERAARLLGYAPFIFGRVIKGEGRGSGHGDATVMLDLDEALVSPEEGMFLIKAISPEREEPGVMYIKPEPSLGEKSKCFEVHLLNARGDELAGAKIAVQLLRKVGGGPWRWGAPSKDLLTTSWR